MSSHPFVSIIIPTYNRRELLKRAVNSALNQTYTNIEVLVCDDEKSDKTNELVTTISKTDSRLRYIENSRTKGACGARNSGIVAALGKFVLFFDDDDEILPEAIKSFLALDLSHHSFAYSWYNRIYDNGRIKISKKPPFITFQFLAEDGQNQTGSMIFTSKEKIINIGMFSEDLPSSQDYDVCLTLTKTYGSAIGISKPLFNLYASRTYERISTNIRKKYIGSRKIALKHGSGFTRQQRARYLYKTRKYLYGEHIGRAFAWLPLKEAITELRRYIKYKFIKRPSK